MFENYLNNLYSIFTATKYEFIVILLIFIIIFAVVFDVVFRALKFSRGVSAVIALVISMMAVFTGITFKATYLVLSLGIASSIIVICALVIVAFIFFALGHFGIRPARRPRRR